MNDPLAFFDYAHENFLGALANVQEVVKYYTLMDYTICLKFAGNAFVDILTPALSHLEIHKTDDRPCDVTICIWDSISTNSPFLKFPNFYCALRGEVAKYNDDRMCTVVDIHTKALNVFDKDRGLALYWIHDHKQLPWWASGSPLQLILHWAMREKGCQLLHAGAVGYPEGGVLLAGKSGSGKSTTVLSCLKAGMKLVSEDYCFVTDLPNISAYNVYNSSKLEQNTLNLFPELKAHIANAKRTENEKAFLYHHQFQPEKILLHFPIKAIVTLQIEDIADSWIESIDFKNVIGPLSLSTMWQLTHTGPKVFSHLKRISEALPCYAMHLGKDQEKIPRLLEALL
jgi:hypothetical protein